MNTIAEILGSVRKKGVRLWSENGQLHYKAPKGMLTQEEIETLRVSRGQIVAFLERAAGAEAVEPRAEPRPRLDRAPLAFSQMTHWHFRQLQMRRSIRQVAFATRLCGRLNIDALRQSVAEIVRRHDALRTRIVVCDGIPAQEIAASGDCELEVDDLTTVSARFLEAEVKRLIEQLIMEPIDITAGPLFGIRLLKLRTVEHVLIVALEHIISDGFSLNILARELSAAYVQTLRGRSLSLPAIPMQFPDYAVWQRNGQKFRIEKHGAYWNERLAGCGRLRFPEDRMSPTETHLGWGTVPLRIGSGLKQDLREWCRLRRTTLVMSVFAAYVALVLRWCNAPEAIFQFQSHGRFSPKIENAIGFFASALYLRLELREDDNFVDLVNRATGEYCKAYEHADFCYMTAQVPRPEFTRNTTFNWLPQGSFQADFSELSGSEDALTCTPIRFAHPMVRDLEVDGEPCVLFLDADDGIVGDIYFPRDRFSVRTMERFARNFSMFVRVLLSRPEERVNDIALCT